MKLINNYHTHTARCGHALGEDEEYVLNAIKAGVEELGFSDHIPFPDVSQPGVRMEYDRLNEYIDSINALKEKYKDQIKIYVGFEAEYFSEVKNYYKDLLKKVDYLICGQHFSLNSDRKMIYSGYKHDDKSVLEDYTIRVVDAIESGLFKYIAHPDIILNSYTLRDEYLDSCIRRICEAAERCHVPLEVNLEGIKKQVSLDIIGKERFYPYDYFWNIAKEYKIDVILGGDIHDPVDFLADYDKHGYNIIGKFGLHHIQKLIINE
ncbi:MAG: histidinol-phosphatase HisJ family protein [Erysipelotrichaceae bacterium]|nr:histidinol-phosphatase HisJ family protein [Erysipelotrichaceae bacterium]